MIDVRVLESSSRGANPVPAGPFHVSSEIAFRGNQRDDLIECFATYVASATTDQRDIEAWHIELELIGTWQRQDGETFDGDHLRSFAVAIGLMTLHPYARSQLQALVGSLGYPPFTLEILHPITALPDDELVDFEDS